MVQCQPTKYLHCYDELRKPSNAKLLFMQQTPINERHNNRFLLSTGVSLLLPEISELRNRRGAIVKIGTGPNISFSHISGFSFEPTPLGLAVRLVEETHGYSPSRTSEITATYSVSKCKLHGLPIHAFAVDPEPLLSAFYVANSVRILPVEYIAEAQRIFASSDASEESREPLKNTALFRFLSELGIPSLGELKGKIRDALKSLRIYNNLTTPKRINALLREAPPACDGYDKNAVLEQTDTTVICLPATELMTFGDPNYN